MIGYNDKIQDVTKEERQQLRPVVKDALELYIKAPDESRPHVMSVYRSSLARYSLLYEKLGECPCK